MSLPLVTRFGADPTVDLELANKQYVDSSSGGGQTFGRVVKTVDEIINNSSTFQDDDELFMPLLANKQYGWILSYMILNVNNAADFKATFTGPSGAVGRFGPNQGSSQQTFALGSSDSTQADGSKCWAHWGKIITDSTPGNLQMQWAQAAATVADTTLEAGSFLTVWESA